MAWIGRPQRVNLASSPARLSGSGWSIGDGGQMLDAATLQTLAVQPGGLTSPFVNLKVRASLDIAVAQLTLLAESAGPAATAAGPRA